MDCNIKLARLQSEVSSYSIAVVCAPHRHDSCLRLCLQGAKVDSALAALDKQQEALRVCLQRGPLDVIDAAASHIVTFNGAAPTRLVVCFALLALFVDDSV